MTQWHCLRAAVMAIQQKENLHFLYNKINKLQPMAFKLFSSPILTTTVVVVVIILWNRNFSLKFLLKKFQNMAMTRRMSKVRNIIWEIISLPISCHCQTVYTVFRQAFLLIQYSFICKQYFFCSDREYQYFLKQIVNKTADCFNNIVLENHIFDLMSDLGFKPWPYV